jgi:hypothetical protein
VNNTYLQDFGTLRRQMHGQEVNDPMSGAGRWDDLQLDLRKPHIPRERRSPVPSKPALLLGDQRIDLKASAVAQAARALGFHSTGSYKHKLVTPKAETYRRRMEEGKPCQRKLWAERDEKFKCDNVRATIRSLVRKARHNPLPSVSDVYKKHIRVLWKVRNILPSKPRVPKVTVSLRPAAVAVAPKPVTERVIPPSALAEFEAIRAKLAVLDPDDKARVGLLLRQQELRRLMWGQP